MKNLNFFKRNPVVPFLVLVYLLPLPIMLLRVSDLPPEPLLFYASWTPNIAAVLVLALIVRKEGGVRQFISGWGKWNVAARWYFAALSPLLIALLASWIILLFGGTTTAPTQPIVLALLIAFLISTFTGALGEELGWRGFLLPQLQQRFSALNSSLVIGVIWALWHAPLWLLPGQGWDTTPYWAFAMYVISSSILITWIYNNSGGSLVMASIFHFSLNFGVSLMSTVGLLADADEYWKVAAFIYVLYAVVVVILSGPERLVREPVNREL